MTGAGWTDGPEPCWCPVCRRARGEQGQVQVRDLVWRRKTVSTLPSRGVASQRAATLHLPAALLSWFHGFLPLVTWLRGSPSRVRLQLVSVAHCGHSGMAAGDSHLLFPRSSLGPRGAGEPETHAARAPPRAAHLLGQPRSRDPSGSHTGRNQGLGRQATCQDHASPVPGG